MEIRIPLPARGFHQALATPQVARWEMDETIVSSTEVPRFPLRPMTPVGTVGEGDVEVGTTEVWPH